MSSIDFKNNYNNNNNNIINDNVPQPVMVSPVEAYVPKTQLSVAVTDPVHIDDAVFRYWIKGLTPKETAHLIQDAEGLKNVHFRFIRSDIIDQYRTLEAMQPFLQKPALLQSTDLFQLPPSKRRFLVQHYFSFDDRVFRELIGKKLNTKFRKDMDDVSNTTGISITSCRRQFDNLRSVTKFAISNVSMEKPMHTLIQSHFCMDQSLVKQYRIMAFLCYYQFNANKRKLRDFTLDDFRAFTEPILDEWTSTDGNQFEIEQGFIEELRDLKGLFQSEKKLVSQYKSIVKNKLSSRRFKKFNEKFPSIIKNLITIAGGLTSARELRDVFIDIVEMVAEYMMKCHLGEVDVRQVFDELITAFGQLKNPAAIQHYRRAWTRFLNVCHAVIIRVLSKLR